MSTGSLFSFGFFTLCLVTRSLYSFFTTLVHIKKSGFFSVHTFFFYSINVIIFSLTEQEDVQCFFTYSISNTVVDVTLNVLLYM